MKYVNMFLVVAVVGVGQSAWGQQAPGPENQQLKHDQLRIAVQKICPVSGQQLGAHGAPVKVKIGEEQLFLCCSGCLKGKINPQHWATIHANFASAQAICPVMNKSLPDHPKSTVVDGQIVYICCPMCAAKIQAEPRTYLQKVDALYTASLAAKRGSP